MSEMTSVEQQHQQQQFVGGSSNSEHHCKDHRVSFESEKSLEVHLRYHQENLLSQWASQAQQEESNNNNSKAGNHNSGNHMVVKRESITAPADSSESSSRPSSEGPASASQQQSTPTSQAYANFPPMYNENAYFVQNEPAYILPHNYSPPRDDSQNGGGSYARYHPYQHQQRYSQPDRANSVSSTSPRSPLHCDKCGVVYDDPIQLADHVRSTHPASPNSYPSQSQYQQMGTSPQHQMQRHQQNQQSQMHNSPSHANQQHQQQQTPGFDFTGGTIIKTEIKQESEEQAEILDLDSHKVQTHRYEEDMLRVQQHQQQQQELQMQMQHHVMQQQQQQQQQQQRTGPHSVSSMLNWSSPQMHEYHSMPPMDNTSPMPDQTQFMRGQHMPVEPPRHGGSPIITSTQPLAGHQIPPALLPQAPKSSVGNQSWKSNEARRPKTYNCTACNKWFTSSGHLKRHYNTTLHKNAVKVSNQPDPAIMPISAHHHPGRDHNLAGRVGPSRSPELSSSGSPPNLMAGPSGEATRGLLLTPITATTNKIHYTTSNSSSSSSESSGLPASLVHPQMGSAVRMSNLVPLNCPPHSPMGHHHHQMPSPSQLGHHSMPMDSPSQMAVHHPMNSPISPMQHPPPPPPHMNSPSPMGPHHHMSSPSPMMAGVPPMASPPPPPMGGTSMPHQPYPNALPPHVTTTTSIPGLMESITSLTTTGNELPSSMHFTQEMLPGFGTFSNHQRPLPSFTNFGLNAGYPIVGHSHPQAVSVGGLSPEEMHSPPDKTFDSPLPNYETYRSMSPPKYDSLPHMDLVPTVDCNLYIKYPEYQPQPDTQLFLPRSRLPVETNNNLPQGPPKEELNPNVVEVRKVRKYTKRLVTKEHQVTSTNIGSHYISQDGFHKCIECDKVFNKACYLTQHNKSFHSGDKPFKCSQCGKRFPHEVMHAEHLQKHAGEKPYKCEICPKQFNHKTDLRRHMCLHTGEKPYTCDTCGKGFIRKDHMMKHLETHRKKSNANHHNVHLRA